MVTPARRMLWPTPPLLLPPHLLNPPNPPKPPTKTARSASNGPHFENFSCQVGAQTARGVGLVGVPSLLRTGARLLLLLLLLVATATAALLLLLESSSPAGGGNTRGVEL